MTSILAHLHHTLRLLAPLIFSLELSFKRENKGVQKAMDVVKGCKYRRHSYLDLSLISGLPGTPIIPFPYGLPNGDGAGVGRVGCGR